mmetsp:Transcript_40484/g.86233  ORF Transcript_40484/g.86233 Transcript_40484/m.86233 type:complete len:85 (+) Transcript_40484:352-606(+)
MGPGAEKVLVLCFFNTVVGGKLNRESSNTLVVHSEVHLHCIFKFVYIARLDLRSNNVKKCSLSVVSLFIKTSIYQLVSQSKGCD